MKYYSEFTTEYVNDICRELSAKGVIADKFENKPFEPESFETLTNFLQNHIVRSLDIFTYLDNLGLVNRGKCPYTGQRIDESFPSWSFMNNRRVYVSHEGYAIMQKEDEEEYEKIMGHPKPQKSASSGKGGCYIATACYGNEFAPEVLHLKLFRDNILAKNYFGRLFIKTYYLVSPPIAEKLKNKEKLNAFIRNQILNKIVKRIQ
ncbi:CFI-box-CTERM domain-containing protein [Maribacter cobaltidurans]|uniref:Uncharacterized protein n=1 Tax=Maribacter cobaltidurans TaxID=1178778 RepID=A0A223V9H5_9FLAO|nr:CFI-box-CTERM domain-containing protein [Maribacter cobaltidurans]ASV31618.1 hypothetical protein CJ263_16125 [Maribacter cobaltidurans]GGD97781.1 hypothetical protein GCM10011412_39830 [Maribacter cobaltidurans]